MKKTLTLRLTAAEFQSLYMMVEGLAYVYGVLSRTDSASEAIRAVRIEGVQAYSYMPRFVRHTLLPGIRGLKAKVSRLMLLAETGVYEDTPDCGEWRVELLYRHLQAVHGLLASIQSRPCPTTGSEDLYWLNGCGASLLVGDVLDIVKAARHTAYTAHAGD